MTILEKQYLQLSPRWHPYFCQRTEGLKFLINLNTSIPKDTHTLTNIHSFSPSAKHTHTHTTTHPGTNPLHADCSRNIKAWQAESGRATYQLLHKCLSETLCQNKSVWGTGWNFCAHCKTLQSWATQWRTMYFYLHHPKHQLSFTSQEPVTW